jgi:hypothetical protein
MRLEVRPYTHVLNCVYCWVIHFLIMALTYYVLLRDTALGSMLHGVRKKHLDCSVLFSAADISGPIITEMETDT